MCRSPLGVDALWYLDTYSKVAHLYRSTWHIDIMEGWDRVQVVWFGQVGNGAI